MSRFDKKRSGGRTGAREASMPVDPILTVECPAIWEYLTISTYDDGSDRVLSTLMVLVEDGQVKCCLNDRDECRSLWVAAGSLQGALRALEELLHDGRALWREYRGYSPGKRKKG